MLVLCIFSENHNKDMWDNKSIVRYNGHKIDFIESQAVNNGLLRPANYQGIWICLAFRTAKISEVVKNKVWRTYCASIHFLSVSMFKNED